MKTKIISYAAHWVAGHSFCEHDELIQIPLSTEKRGRNYFPRLDDPYREFTSSESAIDWVKNNIPTLCGRFVRIMEYSTPSPENAMKYCKLRGADGLPVKIENFTAQTRFEVPDGAR